MTYDVWHGLPVLYVRIGITSERPTTPPSRQAGFWDYEAGILYISNLDQTWVEVGGSSGGALPTGAFIVTYGTFDYTQSSPFALRTVGSGEVVREVRISVETVFDGGMELSVGNAGFSERLMAVAQNDPETIGMYTTSPEYNYTGGGTVNLYLSSSGATQGSGRIVLTTYSTS